MKIISKFKDYYDLQTTMYDESQVWFRKTHVYSLNMENKLILLDNNDYRIYVSVIFIAGSISYCYIIENLYRDAWSYQVPYPPLKFFFDSEKLLDFLDEQELPLMTFYNIKKKKSLRRFNKELLNEKLNEILNEAKKLFSSHEEALMYLSYVPKWFFDKDKRDSRLTSELIINPCFKDLKIPILAFMDAYTLHQKLEQYIFGVLPQKDKKVIQVSDIDRLESHGFDKKMSFRKCKSEK